MRLSSIHDYFKLRRLTVNPLETLRFRSNRSLDASLEVHLRDGTCVCLRGGRSDFHMFHRIYLRDEYRLNDFSPESMQCVVDLGGNVGLFSSRAASLARRVIVYEPVPENFAQLERNVGALANVTAVCAAVSGHRGSLEIHTAASERRSGISSAFPEAWGPIFSDRRVVPTIGLDDLFETHDVGVCDLLKIDVEGSEYDILHAVGDETFGRVRRIHGEYHNVRPDDPRSRIAAFTAFLGSKGYGVDIVPHARKPNHGMFFASR